LHAEPSKLGWLLKYISFKPKHVAGILIVISNIIEYVGKGSLSKQTTKHVFDEIENFNVYSRLFKD
jgi:hypothetical protein